MTNQKRAQRIVQLLGYNPKHFTGTPGHMWEDAIQIITSQLDEAQLEVLEQNEVLVKIRIDEAVREAYTKGFHEGQEGLFQTGFASAREKAAGIAIEIGDTSCGFPEFSREIAERIRNMEVSLSPEK